MVIEGTNTYHEEHHIMYVIVQSLYCTLETI